MTCPPQRERRFASRRRALETVGGLAALGVLGASASGSVAAEPGDREWVFETDGVVFSSPTVADGAVLVGAWDDNVYAVDASTGEREWVFETGNQVWSSPTVAGDTAFFGSADGSLYAVDADAGEQQWAFETPEPIQSSPTVADGTVFVGSNDGNLYAVDAATGERRWTFETGDWVDSSPTVADGTVFVGSADFGLHAVDAGVDGSGEGSRAELETLGHRGSVRSGESAPGGDGSAGTDESDGAVNDSAPGFGVAGAAAGIGGATYLLKRRFGDGPEETPER